MANGRVDGEQPGGAEDVMEQDDQGGNPFSGVGLPEGFYEIPDADSAGVDLGYGLQDGPEGTHFTGTGTANGLEKVERVEVNFGGVMDKLGAEPGSSVLEWSEQPDQAPDHNSGPTAITDDRAAPESWSTDPISLYPTQFPQMGEELATSGEEAKPNGQETRENQAPGGPAATAPLPPPSQRPQARSQSGEDFTGTSTTKRTASPTLRSEVDGDKAKRPRVRTTNEQQPQPQPQPQPPPQQNHDQQQQRQQTQPGSSPSAVDRRPSESMSSAEAREKKQRLVWTPELHDRFLASINTLGIQNAVPKTVLQYMNVPHLTTEHVKSHLQKYRNNLRKEAAAEAKTANMVAPVSVAARGQAVNMNHFGPSPMQGAPPMYQPGVMVANVNDMLHKHIDWQTEVHDQTMRLLLQMQMNHHQMVTLQRKAHLNLERQSRLGPQQAQRALPLADELLKEYESLFADQNSLHDELNNQQSQLRKLIADQSEMRQRFMDVSRYTRVPMPPS